VAAPTRTLHDVGVLVDEAVAAGMPLVATVFVCAAEDLDPHIGQAVFRIVQELLTNARKHASDVGVRLSVTGGPPEVQLVIATANHLAPPPLTPMSTGLPLEPGLGQDRPGTGLTGIRERLEHHGGEMQCDVDEDGVFRVSIRLPWVPTLSDHPRGDG
jgi:signal transduction histidine kinase